MIEITYLDGAKQEVSCILILMKSLNAPNRPA